MSQPGAVIDLPGAVIDLPKEILGALEVGPAMSSTLEASFHMSELLGAKLRFVHVTPPLSPVVALVMGKEKVAAAEAHERETVLHEAAAAANEWGYAEKTPVEFVHGDPGEELSRLTAGHRLLVFSVHGGGHSSYGSTARRLVRAAAGPILCVQAEKKGFRPWKHVLIALDASGASKQALALAHELTRREKARLEALHVFEGPTRGLASLFDSEAEIAALVEKLKVEVAKRIAPVVSSVSPAPKLDLIEGYHPARRIAPYAQLHRHDLIVMGSRIDPERRDMVLGSVADELIALATQDVLVVKSPV